MHKQHTSYATSSKLCLTWLIVAIVIAFISPHLQAADEAKPKETLPGAEVGTGIVLDFREATLETVLEYLSEEAGLIIVNGVDLDARITVYSRQPISIDAAVDLLNTVLKDQGYTAIRRARLLQIVKLDEAKVHSIPVRFGSDPEQIGQSDTLITQIIPIKYAKAVGLAVNIKPLINSKFAVLEANESSNSLILTDLEANVRRIVMIVRALDQSISQVTTVRVFHLEYADATATASLIEQTFQSGPTDAEQLGRSIQQRFRGFRGGSGRGGGGGDASSASGLQSREVSAAADERTNSVVVSAAPDLMDAIAAVIEELDSDSLAKESVLIYHVKNMQATSLAELFNELFEDDSSNAAGGGGGGNNRRAGQQGGGGPFGGFRGRNTAAPATPDTSGTDLVGQVTAVAEEDTNTLLILTQQKNFDRIRGILLKLDRAVPQVLIRVLVSEVTFGDELDVGVEFEAVNVGATDDTNLMTFFDLFESSLGMNFLLFDSDNFKMAIRALAATGRFDVLSRPYLLTADNQEANITVGESVPFVTNSRETNEGQTINTIEYRDVGIILTVTPRINDDGIVVLEIVQELSALTEDTLPVSEELDAVIIKQRSIQTTVSVANGQTVVIGGLMEDVLQERVTKVPLLGDLPLIGILFRRTEMKKTKTELLLFLTPEVINNPGDLSQTTQRIRQNETERLDEAVEPGMLRKHLESMQVKGKDVTE